MKLPRRGFFAVLLAPLIARCAPKLPTVGHRYVYLCGPRFLFRSGEPACSADVTWPPFLSIATLNGKLLMYCVAASEAGWAIVRARTGNGFISPRYPAEHPQSVAEARRAGREIYSEDGHCAFEVLRGDVRIGPAAEVLRMLPRG